MKNRLLWKLVGINVAVIGTVILVVWLAIDYLAAGYFTVLMDKYHISPNEAHAMFLDAVHRYLIWASLSALGLALVLSFWLTKRVLRPLSRMSAVTRRLAAGDYSARVGIGGEDEIGRLGQAFDRMADNLARIEGLRKQMVADAAHELRTPLTNIRGYLEALCDGVIAPSQETLEMLHSEVLRLVKLAESLVDLARADAARTDFHSEVVSLRKLVVEALELGRPNLDARNLDIQQVIPADADRVQADPDKLRQVLRNLVENAGQYAAEGGRFKVSAARIPEGVCLTFVNDGETFSAGDAPFIFERFYRADKSRAREHGGAGIGLAIVKELVETHGGTVGASSGGGATRIWLILPAGDAPKLAVRRAPLPSATVSTTERAASQS
jgi:signal transduction histidine kinase